MTMLKESVWPSEHIGVTRLSDREWKVCDRRRGTDDGLSIIGFIEEQQGVFEVITFGDPLRFDRFSSLEAAIDSFGAAPRNLFAIARARRLSA